MSPRPRQEWRELVELLALSTAIAALIVIFIAQPFVVDGTSMEPSLHAGERVVVSKLAYRTAAPRRGDVVVFRFPADRRMRFIKRVIGLPGESVAIRDGKVLVNGHPLVEPYLVDETLGDFPPEKVPAGHYFVLGDNRPNSRDSRYPEVGMVPARNLVGKAVAVYWPLALAGKLPEAAVSVAGPTSGSGRR
ncbi:MAG: signal peptidase I [Chitinophagales bacterium]